jgi:CCR4-NOT transcription complex subunit 4
MSKYQSKNTLNIQNKLENIEQSKTRIITKNLVYVIGLSQNISKKELLLKNEYFGQYGTIIKLIINKKR